MKARPALLALLSATILAMAAPTEVTPLPALPPTVYAQPAGKIKVRIDGKGYLLPEELKPTVTKLPRGSDKKSAGLIGPFSTTLVDTGTGKLPGKVPP